MSFLNLKNKYFLISGVSNRKSVAYVSAKLLEEEQAKLIFTIETKEHQERLLKLFPECESYILNVENQDSIKEFGKIMQDRNIKISGFLHSLAFANFSNLKEFHATGLDDFQQAMQISSFSLVQMSNILKDSFENDASVVTISISDTKATSYGYMGPIKAMLESFVSYLAKSFSAFSKVRFNAVCSGPLKTSASAGIPNYINNYLFAEKLTMRKESLKTIEVANTVAFLLSTRSSGINGTGILIDAGMRSNYFDSEVVNLVSKKLNSYFL